MSGRVEATVRDLERNAGRLRRHAAAVDGPTSLLLRFYAVECQLKERFLTEQLARRSGTTALLVDTAGDFGHDLGRGLKAVKAPNLGDPPQIAVRDRRHPFARAHEAWRYGAPTDAPSTEGAWLDKVIGWLEESR